MLILKYQKINKLIATLSFSSLLAIYPSVYFAQGGGFSDQPPSTSDTSSKLAAQCPEKCVDPTSRNSGITATANAQAASDTNPISGRGSTPLKVNTDLLKKN